VFNLFVGMTEWLRKKAVESTRLFYSFRDGENTPPLCGEGLRSRHPTELGTGIPRPLAAGWFISCPRISQNDRTTAAKQIVCSLKGHKSLSRDNYFIGNDIECPFIRHEKPKREKS
jgi:hypothetical protein